MWTQELDLGTFQLGMFFGAVTPCALLCGRAGVVQQEPSVDVALLNCPIVRADSLVPFGKQSETASKTLIGCASALSL